MLVCFSGRRTSGLCLDVGLREGSAVGLAPTMNKLQSLEITASRVEFSFRGVYRACFMFEFGSPAGGPHIQDPTIRSSLSLFLSLSLYYSIL